MSGRAAAQLEWPQVLAWRLRRQLLDPIGTEPVEGVVGRLGAIQATNGDLAIRVRRSSSSAGDLAQALADGRVISSFAFRGATHLMTPESAGAYLALRKSARMFELPSWQRYYGLLPSDWDGLRAVVREALAAGPKTVDEIVAAIGASPRFAHLGPILAGNPWSVMKAIAWHGDMSFGQARGRQSAFQLLDRNPLWPGLSEVGDAATWAIEAYLRAYGPATPKHLQYWLGAGLGAARKLLQGATATLRDRLVEVQVEGQPCLAMTDDLDELVATRPSSVVRLLPAYDQWVLGPGTADPHVV
ncbi:MAG TPA: crosslink repair DNA glycosylase YcaQ family protein, partial [Candidatus Limnocylindrales bacterium]